MIERYTLPEMGAVWTEEARMRAWLDVEIAAVKAWNKLGKVPDDALEEIVARADFDVYRVTEIEATTNHDVIAFLTNVAEYVGDASKYVHYGMTSSDMLDTGMALQIGRAGRPAGARPRRAGAGAQAARLRVPRHRAGGPHARHPRGAHHLRHEAGHLGLRGGAPPGPAAARHGRGLRGQDQRRRGRLQQHRPACGGAGVRRARHRLRAHQQPGGAARPARRVPQRAGPRRRQPREVRGRGAPPAAHRGARGRGGVRQGPEGVLGHAPQAQPHPQRAHGRLRPGAARQRPGGHGERGAVARARHQPQLRRAHRVPRQLHPAGLHAAEVHRPHGHGWW